MHFSQVAHCFAQIDTVTKRTDIMMLLAELLGKATPSEAQYITYLALGALRPPYQETVFGLAEKSFITVATQLLHMDETHVRTLLRTHGDMGKVIEQGSWNAHNALSVTEVYHALIAITDIKGAGSQEERAAQTIKLMHQVSPQQAGCIARIMLGKLRLGFSDMTLIDALSWMITGDKSLHAKIEHAYNICADLGLIAHLLKKEGSAGLEHMSIQLGIPIRPAAAERLEDPQAIFDKIGDCVAQPKIDGFRLQIHLDTHKKTRIHFFSRNLVDMSDQFPDLAQAIEKLPVKNAIFEGEAICYDAHHHAFLPFQETVKRKRKHDIETVATELPLTLFLFDLLYLDGTSYLDKTHHERHAALTKLCSGGKSAHLRLIEEKKMHSAHDIETYFHEAIEEGLEGIMVKRINAHYQPGKRNFNWIKLKRTESVGGLADSIDAVIVGYNFGRGKRAQLGIGALLVAIYDQKNDRFVTIAKVGTGLSDEQWREIKKLCDKHATDKQPHNVVCNETLTPSQWVTPHIVCAIRADEITKSPVHGTHDAGGYALRFPRFMNLRPDKKATDATTVTEIVRLYSIARGA